MTLMDMYRLIELILNKDYAGNIVTPDRFNQLIKVVNIAKFKEKYGLPEEYRPGSPVPAEYAEVTLKNQDDLRRFKELLEHTECPEGLLPYPKNYAHRDQITYIEPVTINGTPHYYPRVVEVLRETDAAGRRGNYTKQPTERYPIAVVRAGGIQIYPQTIGFVDFTYYRWPVIPEFAYHQHEGYISYNAAASVEFEWPEDVHLDLTRMILEYLGVNLREADIVQYANLKAQTGV